MFSSTASRVRKLGLPALVALAATIGLAPPNSAAASTGPFGYTLTGTGSSVPGGGSGCVDCQGPTMSASGTAACGVCTAGTPTGGNFTLNLGVQTYPASPCKVKSVSGTLQINWSDGTTSSATVSGKLRDSKALALSGTFAGTDPAFADDAAAVLLDNFPPNPCRAATSPVTGSLAISGS